MPQRPGSPKFRIVLGLRTKEAAQALNRGTKFLEVTPHQPELVKASLTKRLGRPITKLVCRLSFEILLILFKHTK